MTYMNISQTRSNMDMKLLHELKDWKHVLFQIKHTPRLPEIAMDTF